MKISFGTLHDANKKSTLGKERTDVVVDVGEGDYFYIAGTFQREGKIAFSLQTGVGTVGREDVERITGQLTLDEMIDAANRRSLEKMGRKLDERETASLKQFATRGEREKYKGASFTSLNTHTKLHHFLILAFPAIDFL